MPSEDASVDHYAALQVPSNAQSNEIKIAYRKLALLYHPDRNHGKEAEANRKFQAIQAAYEVLNDPTRRTKYDRARLAAGYGAAPAPAAKSAFSAQTTTATPATPKSAATTPSKTAKRYTSAAAHAASMKTDRSANDFKAWSSGQYTRTANEQWKTSRESDDERKRREKEKEKERESRERERDRDRERLSRSSRGEEIPRTRGPKPDFARPDSPAGTSRRKGSSAGHSGAYPPYYSRPRDDDPRSRGRSPDPSHTSSTRATTGHGGDSDQDNVPYYGSRSWSASKSAYSFTPNIDQRFTMRPNSPIPEGRTPDSRYRYHEPPSHYHSTPRAEDRYGRHNFAEPSRKSRSDDTERHVPPPSPPPDKEKDRSRYKKTFQETSEEEAGPKSGGKSTGTHHNGHKKEKPAPRSWGQAYVESEDSDDGAQADDEKVSDDRSFEEKMAGLKFGTTRDEKLKSSSWEPRKEHKPSSSRNPPDTPRRTPSPTEKKKTPARNPSPNTQAPQPQPTVPPAGVFAFQVRQTAEVPIAPNAQAFDWRAAFSPNYSGPPRFAQYQTPVYAPAPTFTPHPPPPAPGQYPFMRPASTQPVSSAQSAFRSAPIAVSDMDLKSMFENLNQGIPKRGGEPNLKGRRNRSTSSKPKLSTKFSEMSISGNSSPVKENTSDASKSGSGRVSSEEDLKQKKSKGNEEDVFDTSAMDIDPPAPPQPATTAPPPPPPSPPQFPKFEPIINGQPSPIPRVPPTPITPAPLMNGFPRSPNSPASGKPNPLSTFHNLTNLYPINAADNLSRLNGMASLKDSLPSGFKSQPSPTGNLDSATKSSMEPKPSTHPQPPKPPTLPLPIRLDSAGKLDVAAYKPYWDAMQAYVDQWREYEVKMMALLQSSVEAQILDCKEVLTDLNAARAFSTRAVEEGKIREEWGKEKEKFIGTIIEYHQLKDHQTGVLTSPVVTATNTSFLGHGHFAKSKIFRGVSFGGSGGDSASGGAGTSTA